MKNYKMKSDLQLAKERYEIYVKGMNTQKEIVSFLKNAGIDFIDDTKESGYLNIKCKVKGGYIRIYKPYRNKKPVIQVLREITLDYSGIPVFDPSVYAK